MEAQLPMSGTFPEARGTLSRSLRLLRRSTRRKQRAAKTARHATVRTSLASAAAVPSRRRIALFGTLPCFTRPFQSINTTQEISSYFSGSNSLSTALYPNAVARCGALRGPPRRLDAATYMRWVTCAAQHRAHHLDFQICRGDQGNSVPVAVRALRRGCCQRTRRVV
jgi:hypothetical protein